MPSPYQPAMQDFAAPARAYPQLWRLLVGLVVFLAAYIGPLAAMIAVAAFLIPTDMLIGYRDDLAAMVTPWATLAILFSFVAMSFGAWAAARVMHRRGLASLIGPPGPALRDFGRVAVYLAVFQGALFLLPFGKQDMELAMPMASWALLLPLTLVAVLIQTSAEELVFRGYLQQQLAARFASPLIWLVGPAVLFGLVHFDTQTMGDNAWVIVIWASIFGLAAGDLTARSGTLGAAVALHFVNNMAAISLVSLDGPLSGLALFKLPFGASDTEVLPSLLWLDLVGILIAWLLARLAIRR